MLVFVVSLIVIVILAVSMAYDAATYKDISIEPVLKEDKEETQMIVFSYTDTHEFDLLSDSEKEYILGFDTSHMDKGLINDELGAVIHRPWHPEEQERYIEVLKKHGKIN
jgi:hypothetical protein